MGRPRSDPGAAASANVDREQSSRRVTNSAFASAWDFVCGTPRKAESSSSGLAAPRASWSDVGRWLQLPNFLMFSTRRPRNLTAGTSSGLKSLTKGLFRGVGGLMQAEQLWLVLGLIL